MSTTRSPSSSAASAWTDRVSASSAEVTALLQSIYNVVVIGGADSKTTTATASTPASVLALRRAVLSALRDRCATTKLSDTARAALDRSIDDVEHAPPPTFISFLPALPATTADVVPILASAYDAIMQDDDTRSTDDSATAATRSAVTALIDAHCTAQARLRERDALLVGSWHLIAPLAPTDGDDSSSASSSPTPIGRMDIRTLSGATVDGLVQLNDAAAKYAIVGRPRSNQSSKLDAQGRLHCSFVCVPSTTSSDPARPAVHVDGTLDLMLGTDGRRLKAELIVSLVDSISGAEMDGDVHEFWAIKRDE